jgi:hypothetical protein
MLNGITGLVLRLWFAAEFTRFVSQQPRPGDAGPVVIDGAAPVRVLVIGAGLGVGYGTRAQQDALSGQLASALHALMQRGIRVETRVEVARPLRGTLRRLADRSALAHDLVVYTPAFGEVHRGHRAGWSRQLQVLVARTSGPRTALVLTGLPAPRVKRPIERITLQRAARVNAAIERAATGGFTAYAAAPTYATPSTYWIFDQEYYRRFAEAVARAAGPLLLRAGGRAAVDPHED